MPKVVVRIKLALEWYLRVGDTDKLVQDIELGKANTQGVRQLIAATTEIMQGLVS